MHSTHDKGNKFGIRLLLLVALMLLLLAHGAWAMPADENTGLMFAPSGSEAIIAGIYTDPTGYSAYAIDTHVLKIPATVTDFSGTYRVVSIEGDVARSGFIGLDIKEVDCTEATYLTSIGRNAFINCSTLETVTLSNSVTSIENNAFQGCTFLQTISMPKITSIGDNAFFNCTSLTTVNMPNVMRIGSSAFSTCRNLSTISMPKMETIESNAFNSCTSLATISLDGTLWTSVSAATFYDTPSTMTVSLIDVDGGVNDATRATRINYVLGRLRGGDARLPIGNITYPGYNLTVNYGTATPTTLTYLTGNEVTITADAPPTGQSFDKWTSDNGGSFDDETSPTTTFTMPANDVTVTATFKAIPPTPPTPTYYTIHLTDIPADIGTVTGGGSFRYGDEASLKANPAEGYRFIGWYKSEQEMSTDAEYTFTVTESCELTAKFEKTDTPTPPQPIPLTFKATKGISYTLEQWTGGILNNATVSATRPKYMSVSADGTIKGLKTTTKKTTPIVTVTVNGETYKTTVTVVANKYTRKNPLKQDAPAVYTSANKLYYRGKFLYANVFLYNGTGVGVKGSDDLVLKIYDGDKQIAERTLVNPWTRSKNLKTGNHTTRLFKIKESELTGVRAKQFDLASGNIHAVLVGTTRNGYPVIPILADVEAKSVKSKADVLVGEFDDVVEDVTEEDIEDVDIEDAEDIEDVGVEIE